MLVGNIVTTLNVDLRRGEAASSIAEHIRHSVDHFADEHCDMRINQQFLDASGAWRPLAVYPLPSIRPGEPACHELAGFGVYRIHFEDTVTSYCTPLMKLPVAGIGALLDGQMAVDSSFTCHCRPRNSRPPRRAPRFGNTCTGFGVPATTFHDCTARFMLTAALSMRHAPAGRRRLADARDHASAAAHAASPSPRDNAAYRTW